MDRLHIPLMCTLLGPITFRGGSKLEEAHLYNPIARKPVDLAAYRRNRRVSRPAPEPKPLPRNQKMVTLKRYELDQVVLSLLSAVVMMAVGIAVIVNAVLVVAPQTPDMLVESLVTVLGTVFIGLGLRSVIRAYRSWKRLDDLEARREQQAIALASVIRPVERKLPVPFAEWMQ